MSLSLTGIGKVGSWWSAAPVFVNEQYRYVLQYDNSELQWNHSYSTEASSVRCIQDEDLTQAKLPVITTTEIIGIFQNVVTSGGVIVSDGGSSITSKGVCWLTEPGPNLYHRYTTDAYDSGLFFISHLTILKPNTTYYVRAYAKNALGVAYGNERVFTTKEELPYGSVSDVDRNAYKTILIGNQTWMAENLKTTKYNNGDLINATEPEGSGYKHQSDYWNVDRKVPEYGRLYTWYAVTDDRNVCPAGWHIPGEAEWDTLAGYLGGEEVAGIKMKEAQTGIWQYEDVAFTNESGFTAFPGGYEDYSSYAALGIQGYWWSAASYNTEEALSRSLSCTTSRLSSGHENKEYFYSVRCLKD